MNQVVLFACTAALNPTLLTATTVMLLLPRPTRLLLGYWLGAMVTSITLGLVIVFSLQGTGAVNTTQRTISPAVSIALGCLALLLALVIATDRHKRFTERRAARREGKEPPRWQRTLSKGTARDTFIVGVLLTLPGASYLASLHALSEQHYSTAGTVLAVVGVNLVMLILLEAPMIAFRLAPEWTPAAIARAKTWLVAHAKTFATWGLTIAGAILVVKGLVAAL